MIKKTTSIFGCLPQDVYTISTGRAASAVATSSKTKMRETSSSGIGDAAEAKHYPSSICSDSDRISIDIIGDSDIDMDDDDDESESDTINVDKDGDALGAYIKLVSVGIQKNVVEVRLHLPHDCITGVTHIRCEWVQVY